MLAACLLETHTKEIWWLSDGEHPKSTATDKLSPTFTQSLPHPALNLSISSRNKAVNFHQENHHKL